MTRKEHKPFVFLAASVAGLGGLLFGFDTGIIADVQGQITQQFAFSLWQWSVIVSATVLGAFTGALLSGKLCDAFGRRFILLLTATGFIISTLILALADHYYTFFIGRLFLGICIGIASYASPLFISEISPKYIRGKLVLINSIAITAGEALSFLVGYMLHDIGGESWRLIFLTGLPPAILLFFGMLFLPKSPRWVASRYGMAPVMAILDKIRQGKEAQIEYQDIQSVLENQKPKPRFHQLFTKKLRPVIFLGIVLGVMQQFAGINTVMYYGPHIFKQAGFESQKIAIFATFILGLVNTLGTIVVVFIVDKIGRRHLLLSGTFIASVSLFSIACLFHFKTLSPDYILAAMMVYIFSYAISLGSLFWLIISEVYPMHLRGLAMSFVTAIQWLANFIVAVSFLPLLHYFDSQGSLFLLFSVMCLLAYIYSYYCVPETKGISLEQIEKNLSEGLPTRRLGYSGQG